MKMNLLKISNQYSQILGKKFFRPNLLIFWFTNILSSAIIWEMTEGDFNVAQKIRTLGL